jgi:hypothetical protein
MAKVGRPLFSDTVKGGLRGVGVFVTKGTSTTFRSYPKRTVVASSAQNLQRSKFNLARIDWLKLPVIDEPFKNRVLHHRVPSWPEFFRQWLIDNP